MKHNSIFKVKISPLVCYSTNNKFLLSIVGMKNRFLVAIILEDIWSRLIIFLELIFWRLCPQIPPSCPCIFLFPRESIGIHVWGGS